MSASISSSSRRRVVLEVLVQLGVDVVLEVLLDDHVIDHDGLVLVVVDLVVLVDLVGVVDVVLDVVVVLVVDVSSSTTGGRDRSSGQPAGPAEAPISAGDPGTGPDDAGSSSYSSSAAPASSSS